MCQLVLLPEIYLRRYLLECKVEPLATGGIDESPASSASESQGDLGDMMGTAVAEGQCCLCVHILTQSVSSFKQAEVNHGHHAVSRANEKKGSVAFRLKSA